MTEGPGDCRGSPRYKRGTSKKKVSKTTGGMVPVVCAEEHRSSIHASAQYTEMARGIIIENGSTRSEVSEALTFELCACTKTAAPQQQLGMLPAGQTEVVAQTRVLCSSQLFPKRKFVMTSTHCPSSCVLRWCRFLNATRLHRRTAHHTLWTTKWPPTSIRPHFRLLRLGCLALNAAPEN